MITSTEKSTFYIDQFGAIPDGETNNAAAIQEAIDECTEAGGGRVVVPAGVFKSGRIILRSRVELHLERGAILRCSESYEDISTEEFTSDDPFFAYFYGPKGAFICAFDAEDVAITGSGVIDGNGRAYIAERLPHIYVMKERRPITFYLGGCKRLSISGVTIRDGAAWTLWLCGCEDVSIEGIRMYNDLKLPNSDGIDIDRCRNVRITDCHIESGDDAIVLKTMRGFEKYGGIDNVLVTGCLLKSTSSAICIGCEISAPVRNVTFDSCIISSSHRGLAINHSYESDIENIVFSNITVETRLFHDRWWGRGEPIYVKALPWTRKDKVGRIRNVQFINIRAKSENGILIWGEQPDRIRDILLENVRIHVAKWSSIAGGKLDLRPCAGENDGYGSGVVEHPVRPFMLHNAQDVTIRNCEAIYDADATGIDGALEVSHIESLKIDGLVSRVAGKER